MTKPTHQLIIRDLRTGNELHASFTAHDNLGRATGDLHYSVTDQGRGRGKQVHVIGEADNVFESKGG